MKNVKENLQNAGITDTYMQKLSCDLLENAKQNYYYNPFVELKTESKTIAGTLAPNTNQIETISADELLFPYKTVSETLIMRNHHKLKNIYILLL